MQKKIFIFILVLFGAFFMINTNEVFAMNTEVVQRLDGDCIAGEDALFGDPSNPESVAYFMQEIFNLFKYAAPILCLVLSVFDFSKAAASQDKDALVKAGKTTGKRLILAFVLFFLPTIIDFLFPLLGWYGTCGIK